MVPQSGRGSINLAAASLMAAATSVTPGASPQLFGG